MDFEYDIINIKEMLMGLLDWLFGTSKIIQQKRTQPKNRAIRGYTTMSVTIAAIPSKIASATIAAEIAKMIEFLKKD